MENRTTLSEICIKCQLCCKSIGVYSLHSYNNTIKEFYEARGATVTKKIIHDKEVTYINFDIPCPHLDSERGCLIYDHRPKVCKNYPEEDNQLLEKCELHKLRYV